MGIAVAQFGLMVVWPPREIQDLPTNISVYALPVLVMFTEKKYLPVAALSTATNGGDVRSTESWMLVMIAAVESGVAWTCAEPENYISCWGKIW